MWLAAAGFVFVFLIYQPQCGWFAGRVLNLPAWHHHPPCPTTQSNHPAVTPTPHDPIQSIDGRHLSTTSTGKPRRVVSFVALLRYWYGTMRVSTFSVGWWWSFSVRCLVVVLFVAWSICLGDWFGGAGLVYSQRGRSWVGQRRPKRLAQRRPRRTTRV